MTGTRQTKNARNSKPNTDTVKFIWDEYGQTHVVNSLSYFKEFTIKEECLSSRFGEVVKSKGYGIIQVHVGPKKRRVWLSEVRYVPEVKGCVFSRHNGAVWGLPTMGTPSSILSTEDDLAVIGHVDDPFASAYLLELKVLKPHTTNVVDGAGDLSEDELRKAMTSLRSRKTRKTIDPWNLRFLAVVEESSK